jgi:Zn-dependent protease
MREDDHQQRLLDAAMDKRLRNLQAVARHLQAGTPGAESSDAPTVKATTSAAQKWKRWGPVGLVLAFVLGKLKLIIPALKFAKLGTLLSMVVAVWVYAQIWGAPFALGFVLLILVHELGHALVMRQQGIPAGAPVFIPFVGAVIAMRGIPRSAWVEALVGIGGPVLGSVGALACLAIASITDSLLWYALASTGFLINLFNLLPISPLDGGRIVGVISRWLWLAGYGIGIAIFLVTYHPLLFLILLFGLFGLGRAIRGPRAGYFETPAPKRLAMGAAYFGLAAVLALCMWAADQHLEDLPTRERATLAAMAALAALLL